MGVDDLEAIRQLKYRYFRFLDTKRFEELGLLFVEEATTAYDSGSLSQQGRAAIVAFLQESLGDPSVVTMHTGHHPEIELVGDDRATGRWYLEDRVLIPAADLVVAGTALYSDRYVRTAEGWRLAHTGYERIYEEQRRFTTWEHLSLRTRFDAT